VPVDSVLKTGLVAGRQILDWIEGDLENAFAKDATRRFGGWFVRYKGLFVRLTIGNPMGRRVQQVAVRGEPLVEDKRYTVLGCEREGDPDDIVCRIPGVQNPRRQGVIVHQVVTEYLTLHSPVAPILEGRAVATDAPQVQLTTSSRLDFSSVLRRFGNIAIYTRGTSRQPWSISM
jgi:hypothetical protein